LVADRGKTEVMLVPHCQGFWKCLVLSSWTRLREMYWQLVWSEPVWGKRVLVMGYGGSNALAQNMDKSAEYGGL
jgi:hypothetical protein